MIIQREGDNEMVMLPVSNLVNGASARMKLHDRATFKIDINSRKQERGMIILFGECPSCPFLNEVVLFVGSEDVCADQLQVLNMNTDDRKDNDLDYGHEHNHNENASKKDKRVHQHKPKVLSSEDHDSATIA